MLDAFGVERSLSKKGCPYDNAVIESTNNLMKRAIVHGRRYRDAAELRREVNGWVWFYNNQRPHSRLDYMSPVEFREAGLSL